MANPYYSLSVVSTSASPFELGTTLLSSTDPYDPNAKDENGWRSKPLEISVSSKHTKNLVIEPIAKASNYTGSWAVREKK